MHSQHYPQPRKRAHHATLERRDEPAVYVALLAAEYITLLLHFTSDSIRSLSLSANPSRPHPFYPRPRLQRVLVIT